MANLVLILGESGTGKSTSIESLDPKETFILQTIKKPLPFKNSYKLRTAKEDGNRFISSDYQTIISIFNWIETTKYKTLIIDDFQYILANEFMQRATERGFDKFTEMAQKYYNIIMAASNLRDDLTVIFMSHLERKDDGSEKVKTIGKLLDEKITVEGLFTIVLTTRVEQGEYFFETQNNGRNTTKSPKGMFKENKIPNDLSIVTQAISSYYGG
ncbi:AAA family ATPase [Peptoniphilus sp.]|uniref:AAA family ATPase n=1 Tax=Peptoniphilus sp. TaxID=1971214 RepID=UPI0039966168